ncbi:hypothetical protein C8R44DRAFT_749232 [Mycena epipterygia]|nr:hypothetical protein C8R44DRAFT_749232 [Mycena epipterygia]
MTGPVHVSTSTWRFGKPMGVQTITPKLRREKYSKTLKSSLIIMRSVAEWSISEESGARTYNFQQGSLFIGGSSVSTVESMMSENGAGLDGTPPWSTFVDEAWGFDECSRKRSDSGAHELNFDKRLSDLPVGQSNRVWGMGFWIEEKRLEPHLAVSKMSTLLAGELDLTGDTDQPDIEGWGGHLLRGTWWMGGGGVKKGRRDARMSPLTKSAHARFADSGKEREVQSRAIRSTRTKWPSKLVASHEADGELVGQAIGKGNKSGLTAIDAGVVQAS